jgi:3-deoxy-7-phosphoheptulonate synthase
MKIVNQKGGKVIDVSGEKIGGKNFTVIAGPCAVESADQVLKTSEALGRLGVKLLRAGAFKPRTSPYSFQGMGEEGLKILAQAREKTGMLIVTEVMDPSKVGMVEKYADIIQIGARNMQNFDLLKAVGKAKKPVLLKRGMSATIEEFLNAAEYIAKEGNHDIILCERGIRTFCRFTRNTLDLNAVPYLKQNSNLPVFADPSHGTGKKELVVPMAKAAIAAGADGIIVEAHINPEEAVSDKDQTLSIPEMKKLMEEIKPFVEAAGKRI